MAGLDWSGSGGSAGGGHGQGFTVDPPAVRAQIAVLRDHVATMRAHGASYHAAVGGLGF